MHKQSMLISHSNCTAADRELAGCTIFLPIQRHRGPHDPNWRSGLQGFFRFLAEERSDTGIHDALRASHQQVRPCRTSCHARGDNFLNSPIESSFVRSIVDGTKASPSVGVRRRLGSKLNS